MFAKRAFFSAGRRSAFLLSATFLSAIFLAFTSCVLAATAAQAAATEDDADEVPPPEPLLLKTFDGLRLAATFYPGPEGKEDGKETVPIVLLHMQKRNDKEHTGNDYAEFATILQKQGHAVLVPDLRGHGQSTKKTVTSRTGALINETLDASNMSRNEFSNMVRFDMPRLKSFLVEKNNAGELNIERLCVIGAEMGASVALHWARSDWGLPPKGNKKQGQDIKLLVLISPEWNTPGLTIGGAMAGRAPRIMVWDKQLKRVFKDPDAIDFRQPVELDFRREVSVMIAVGKERSKSVSSAARLHRMFKTYHADLSSETPPAEKDLLYGTLKTSLQGSKMLGVKALDLERDILWFIENRAAKRPFRWAERTDPYGQ